MTYERYPKGSRMRELLKRQGSGKDMIAGARALGGRTGAPRILNKTTTERTEEVPVREPELPLEPTREVERNAAFPTGTKRRRP